MVTQKLVSLKLDSDMVDQLENVKSLYGINKNKLINYSLRFILDAISLQELCTNGSRIPNIIKDLV